MATAASLTAVQKIYIAFYQRPADSAGQVYWAGRLDAEGGNLNNVINAFANSPEATALYGAITTTNISATVKAIYLALFNRVVADTDSGLKFWVDGFNAGTFTPGKIALEILNAAQGDDAVSVQNKLQVANSFSAAVDGRLVTAANYGQGTTFAATYSGTADAVAAREMLSKVTSAPSTVLNNTQVTDFVIEKIADAGDAIFGASSQIYTLTNGMDVRTANVFNAPQVYTPGGNDRINSLQNEDVLTGTGTNATLNATLGNPNDNGNALITPTLKGIATINAAFDATTANMVLDLQDSTGQVAINMTRVAEGANATVQNIAAPTANLSVANSQSPNNNVNFTYLGAALTGAADATTLTVSNVRTGTLRVEQNAVAPTEGYETINLVSAGAANTITTLQAEDLATLNITGAQALTISGFANAAGSLSRIDGSTATGALDLTLNGVLSATADGTSGTNIALTTITGTGADRVRITNDSLGTTDSINTGDGVDTLDLRAQLTNNFTPATTGAALVTNAENLLVTRTVDAALVGTAATLTVDMARIGGDQTTTLSNLGDANDLAVNFVLNNMSAGDAAGLRITHSTTANNGIGFNVIDADVDTGVTTVGVSIREGVNTDPRFNFTLNADSDNNPVNVTNTVVNVTLGDNDSESNSVLLGQVARHTGTLTVSGGTAGTFLSLDATAGVGYGRLTNGAAGDETTIAAATAPTGEVRDTAVASAFVAGGAGQVGVFTSIAAAGLASDLEVRLGASNTNAQLGTGNDTVIFADRAGITAATSGLTIQDTVAGGTGTDTVVLDGTGVMTLGASEWTNLSGVDVVRLAGVAGGTFNLRVTDQLVDQTDSTNRITIVNNDGRLTTNTELTANIDLRALSASNAVTFVGNNSNAIAALGTVQTVILNDVTANGNNFLNGGDVNVLSEYTLNGRNATGAPGAVFASQILADAGYVADRAAGLTGNNNVLRIFNTSEVTVGDLSNTSNFSTIQFHNDAASVQTLNLTLSDAVVDALVDASHTASANQTETLTITATDNPVLLAATATLNVQAGTVGAQFLLNIAGAGGADVIAGGAGADVITGGAGADAMTGGLGVDRFVINATDSLNTALDTITDFTAGTDILDLAVVPTSLVAGPATAQFTTAAAVATSGATAASLAVDLAAAVAAQIVVNATFWDSVGDTIAVLINGASVAGNNVTYIVQNQAANVTYDTAVDTVVALVGTSTTPVALASFA